MNYRSIIVATAALMTTTATFAQFGGLLNNLGGFKHEVQHGITIDETPLQAS